MAEFKGNKFIDDLETIAENACGTQFTIGDVVCHDGADDEIATITGFKWDEEFKLDIIADTTKGSATIDFLYMKDNV